MLRAAQDHLPIAGTLWPVIISRPKLPHLFKKKVSRPCYRNGADRLFGFINIELAKCDSDSHTSRPTFESRTTYVKRVSCLNYLINPFNYSIICC